MVSKAVFLLQLSVLCAYNERSKPYTFCERDARGRMKVHYTRRKEEYFHYDGSVESSYSRMEMEVVFDFHIHKIKWKTLERSSA